MKKLFFILTISTLVGGCKTTQISTSTHSEIPVTSDYTYDKMLTSQRELARKMETWPPEAIEDFKKRYIYKTVTVITPTDTIVY